MDFFSLFEYSQVKALEAAITPSMESIWKIKCREYSERFHTPLHTVINDLDPLFILQNLNEYKYPPSIVDEELQELLDILQKIKDPNYSRMTQEQTEELVDAVLNREQARFAKKKAPTTQEIQHEVIKEAVKPKSGSMDFTNLEKIDSESESNKSGF